MTEELEGPKLEAGDQLGAVEIIQIRDVGSLN